MLQNVVEINCGIDVKEMWVLFLIERCFFSNCCEIVVWYQVGCGGITYDSELIAGNRKVDIQWGSIVAISVFEK